MEGSNRRVEVIESKTCSKLRVGFTPSRRCGTRSPEPASPVISSDRSTPPARPDGPFSGLIICVTGLSRDARKQVMEATEKLGGEYSPNLNSLCTHLVVQSCDGRKFEHASKHGAKDGLHIVTLGWFVDSVRGNVKLSESLYVAKCLGESKTCSVEPNQLVSFGVTDDKSCLLVEKTRRRFQGMESICKKDLVFSGYSLYIDPNISGEVRDKVLEIAVHGGAKIVNKWFVGCNASHVVCESGFARRYLGHTSNLVTPRWVLKAMEDEHSQRLVQISADLARDIGTALEIHDKESFGEGVLEDASTLTKRTTCEDKQKIIESAKKGVRNRGVRHTKTDKTPAQSTTPSRLLGSICWTISEPTSTASVYTGCCYCSEEACTSGACDAETYASFTTSTRLLTESEKKELVYKNHFLTILFPIDRYGEMGPSARTYFSKTGFTCVQILDHIYRFYQENISEEEIEATIHTDSRQGERLRAAYSDRTTVFKRVQFLGCRKSFETLKCMSCSNCSNVYELVIKA